MKRNTGFTLIELMVTVALAAIILTFGVPAFQSIVANNAGTTETNRILGSIQAARSAAVNRGQAVTVCGANSAMDDCAATVTDWGNGWLIMPRGGSSPLRVYDAADLPPGFTVSGVSRAIVFDGMGNLEGSGAATISVQLDCSGTTATGDVTISPTGNARADAPSC